MNSKYFSAILAGALIASVIIQLTACQVSDTNKGTKGVPVTAKGTGTGEKPAVQKGSFLNPDDILLNQSNMTPEQKETSWIKLNMELLNQEQQFFSEGWKIASRDSTAKISSVFGQTLKIMQDATATKAETAGNKCSGKDLTTVIAVPQKDQDQNPTVLQILVQDCNKKQVGWIAKIKQTTKNQIEIHFNPARLLEGAGERAVAMIKADKGNDIQCVVGYEDDSRVKMMSCYRLSQTLAKGKNLVFDAFTFDASSSTILTMKTTTYGEDFLTVDSTSCAQSIAVPAEGGKKISYMPSEKCQKDSGPDKAADMTIDKNSLLLKPRPLETTGSLNVSNVGPAAVATAPTVSPDVPTDKSTPVDPLAASSSSDEESGE